jgi:glycosyltransferase involved in cell wall biosynthesis
MEIFVITMDDDLQHPPEEINKLIEKQTESQADLVYGIYQDKKHSTIRNAGSSAIKKSTKMVLKAPGKGSSFRLITHEVVEKMLTHYQRTVFIDELVLWYTGNIAYADVDHHLSKNLKSRYSFFKLLMLSAKIFFYSTVIPLKLMIYGGFFASLVSFGIGIYHIYRKVFFKVPTGYTSVIVTIFFSTSILLFSLGIIGEYLRRIYEIQNKRTPYIIRKIF